MRHLIYLTLCLILASAGHARTLSPEHFRAVHTEMLRRNMGSRGNCWESATAVWKRATEYGYKVKLIRWDLPHGQFGHVIPAVEIDGRWHHFRDDGERAYTVAMDEVVTDRRWLSSFTGHAVAPGSVEVLEKPRAHWLEKAREPVWR